MHILDLKLISPLRDVSATRGNIPELKLARAWLQTIDCNQPTHRQIETWAHLYQSPIDAP